MGQIWTKLAKINRFSNFFDNFSHFSDRGTHPIQFWTNTITKWDFFKKIEKFHFWSIFANFSHILWTKNPVLKKVGRTRPGDLFKFWYFLNLHALGYPKSETKIFCEHFWVNKSLSMMWIGVEDWRTAGGEGFQWRNFYKCGYSFHVVFFSPIIWPSQNW
jgi:hypothetical protein